MLNASVGVQRVLGRLRRPHIEVRTPATPANPASPSATTTDTLQARSLSAARHVRDGVGTAATSAHLMPRRHGRRRTVAMPALPMGELVRRLGHERTVGLVVAVIVLTASVLSVAPGNATSPTSAQTGDIGGPTGDGPAPRLVVGGGAIDPEAVGNVEEAYAPVDGEDTGSATTGDAPQVALAEPAPGVSSLTRMGDVDMNDPSTQAVIEAADRAAENDVAGPFLADGTLLKPIAVDTVVADGSGLMRTYKVKAGDTLSGIAKKYDV